MEDKYYRLVCLVVNVCSEPLREFFLNRAKSDPAVPAVYTDLGAYLIQRQPQIANLKTRKIIRQDQYDLVFPSAGIAKISDWDVTLLVTLIKNLFVIKPLEEFLLEEMRKIRNYLQHISNTSAISDGEFDSYWNRLEKAAKTLAREVSGTAYETEIDDKVREARYSNLPSLGNTLRIFYEEDRKEMSSKIASMEETIKSLEAKLDVVTASSAVSTSILSNVTVTKPGPNGEKVKRFKAVDDILHRLIKQFQNTMQTELPEHFTPPKEIVDIEAKLNDTHYVIVAGARNSPFLETALYVIKNRAYNLQRCVEMNDASDWRHIDPDEVDLVLIKNPFGSYCYDETRAKSMLNIFDSIYQAVQPKQGLKTLDVIIVSDFAYLTEVNRFKEHELLNEVVQMFEPTSPSAPAEIRMVAPTSAATSSNHFVRQMTDMFLGHFYEESKRIDENTVKAAKDKLKKNKILVITGPAESGKTSLAVALAKSYAKDEVLMFSSPDKIETIDFQRTSLVIIDDFVGKYGFQRKKVIEWFLRFDQLYLAVTAGKLNIIVTCETSQLDKCNDEIKSHPLLSYPLVLTKLPKLVKQESSGDPGILEENNENNEEEKYEEVSEDEVEEEDEEKVEEEEEETDEDDDEEDGGRNPLFLQPRRPYIQSEALERPFGPASHLHHVTQQTTWQDPRKPNFNLKGNVPLGRQIPPQIPPNVSLKNLHQLQGLSMALPEGWEQAVTPEGETFYVNHNERTTSWFDPRLPMHMQRFNVRPQPGIGQMPVHSQAQIGVGGGVGRAMPAIGQQQTALQKLQEEKEQLRKRQEELNRQEMALRNSNNELTTITDPFLGQNTTTDLHARQGSTDSGLGGMGSGTSFMSRTPEEFLSNVSEMDGQDGGHRQGDFNSMDMGNMDTEHSNMDSDDLVPSLQADDISNELLNDVETVLNSNKMDDSLLTWL